MSFARVRALAVVGLLVVAAAVFVTIALVKDRQTGPTKTKGCAQGAVIADPKLPLEDQVNLNIYKVAGRPGLASDIKNEFNNRKFKAVVPAGDPTPPVKTFTGVAVIRYGPKTVGAAWLVRAYFLDQTTNQFDKTRQDNKVDIILGPKFQQLATTTEVNQALAQLGNPTLPEGTCAAK